MNALQLFRSQVSQKGTLCQNSFERRAHLDEKQLYRSFSPLGAGAMVNARSSSKVHWKANGILPISDN